MKIVIQKVRWAKVLVNDLTTGSIQYGLLILLGISKLDSERDADYLAAKLVELRIFNDQRGKLNLSVKDVAGELLVVPNFTLYGDTRKGKRPSFDQAASPDQARPLYEYFVERCRSTGVTVETGVFQAHMQVTLENDGPITLICDSQA
jgi:D-aminoacyl-tRNA deacylase